ncbi:Uncharacterised protein [Raoultella terrigena]|uniref:Uncharacterized protein n=1 Tax=Raoultella terrigena TaxID=577 RepID=A0A4U9DE71_RAOTE|nr:Uncharacterised protein [Raoultella terrigena]
MPGIKESQRLLNFEAASRNVGLVILLAIICIALAGGFSVGYFSEAEKTNPPGTLKIDYEYFGRAAKKSFASKSRRTRTGVINMSSASAAISMKTIEPGSIWPQPDGMYSQGKTLYLIYNNVKNKGDFAIWLYVHAGESRGGRRILSR